MTARAALLASAAVAGAAAWVVTASAGMLAASGLWNHPHFANGPAWTWAWLSYAADPAARAAAGPALAWGAAGGALAVGAVAARLWYAWGRQAKPLHGKSAYATEREAERRGITYAARPRGDSILIGQTKGMLGLYRRYICLPGTDHVALYARTGAGKGASFVVPSCFFWDGSLVAFDIKGELYRYTAGHRAAMGQDVFFFAPTAPDGRSHRYNPFSVVPRGEAGCIDAIHRIMHILIPPNARAENPFWTNSARALASGGAIMLACTPGERLNPAAVLRMFTRPDHNAFIRGLVAQARADGRPLPQVAVDVVLSWANNEDPKTREGILEELKSHFALYASPQIAAATEDSNFDLRDLRRRGMSIYIGATPDELRRLRPLMTVLFQQLVSLNTQAEFKPEHGHTHRVLMMLDEFWAPGRMDMLADAAAFVRSYGIRMAYVVQTKAQLVSIYGAEGSENLFQNTGAEIVFGASDMKLCREISERAGNNTVMETSTSRPRFMGWLFPGRQSESETARRRALLLPQEVQRMPEDEQLIFRPGMQPLRTQRVRWYTDRTFKPLEVQAPEVPRLAVHVAPDDGTAQVA